jgi:hypothetical protein
LAVVRRCRGSGRPALDAGAHGRLQRPDVAVPGQEIETARGAVETRGDIGDEAAERLAVPLGRRRHAVDGGEELRVRELAGDAERAGEIEVPDPQAVDALHGRDLVGILGTRRRLDLHEQAVARVEGRELLRHRSP